MINIKETANVVITDLTPFGFFDPFWVLFKETANVVITDLTPFGF